ncbi:FliA/WhiG family RNA polymerase sigma factor [Planctomycetota bacterium]
MQLNTFDNRRKEKRHNFKNASASWRTDAVGPWLDDASLHDISASGVCLLVPQACQPNVGQDIELFRNKKAKQKLVCHVLRTEPWINDKTMVGGRLIVTSNQPAFLPLSPRVLKARKKRQGAETKTNEQEKADKNDDVQELWVQFQKERSTELRNRLVEHYHHLVIKNATLIHAKLPNSVAFEDLASAGIFGLISAIEAFDQDREVKFSTYCYPRIRGAMLDECRSRDWVPRLARSRAHKLENACKALEDEHGYAASDEEIAKSMGISMEELFKIKNDVARFYFISMSHRLETDNPRNITHISDILEDKRSEEPSEYFQRHNLIERFTKELSRVEKLVLHLYYFEGMNIKEVGATLGLSGVSVSEIHLSIVARLRDISQDNDLQIA